MVEALKSQHRTHSLFYAPVVLLDHVGEHQPALLHNYGKV
jgi:hypothetical protein